MRMRNKDKTIEQAASAFTQAAGKQGHLLEAGWIAYCLVAKIPPEQRLALKLAYMAGAEHLYSSLMHILEPGDDPTTADLKMMERLDAEIQHYRAILEATFKPTQGST